jgi:hypothetical protein
MPPKNSLIALISRYNSGVTKRATSHSSFVTRDSDIRGALLAALRQIYNDKNSDLIVEEFGCNYARTDVAVINGAMHAFEIKSDSDTLERLPLQVEAYQGVFQYVSLVCGQRLFDRARNAVPRWWGLQRAQCKNGEIILQQLRTPKLNPRQNRLALARMLWKTEALACLRKYGHKVVTSRHPADEVFQAVAECISVSILTDEVRQAIKLRGGSGFARRSTQYGDSCTTESTAPANHSPDLSWLLLPQYQHRPD